MSILTVTLNPCIDKTITVDGFNYGGLNRVLDTREDAGGKGINVAKVLKTFDEPCVAYAMIGGQNGKRLAQCLENENIDAIYTNAEGEVRTNQKIVNIKDGITTEINEKGFTVSCKDFESAVEKIENLICSCDVVVLAGSIPNGVDEDVYAKLIKFANAHNTRVILDADANKLKYGIGEKPYAIKPNLFEFEELIGKKMSNPAQIAVQAKKLIDSGLGLVVVSMGADGAVFTDGVDAFWAKPFDIECKSTVGAGDSMVALMAYSLCRGYDLETLAKLCVCAGSITSSKEGTMVCTSSEVVGAKDKVTIWKIDTN